MKTQTAWISNGSPAPPGHSPEGLPGPVSVLWVLQMTAIAPWPHRRS